MSYTTRGNKVDNYSLKFIEGKLRRLGYSCYIDLLHNDSKNKQQRVFNELISSDIFMAIVSEDYHLSHWAQKEITLAYKLKKEIVKVDYRKLNGIKNKMIIKRNKNLIK